MAKRPFTFSTEWSLFGNKKEEPKEKTFDLNKTVYTLWEYVRFFNKNNVKEYEKAIESMSKDYSKFLSWSIYGKDNYDGIQANNDKIDKWSRTLPSYFKKCISLTTSIIKSDLGVAIPSEITNPYYTLPDRRQFFFNIVEESGVSGRFVLRGERPDNNSAIVAIYHNIPESLLIKLIGIIDKEKNNMVPFDYNINIPTFNKLCREFIDSDKSNQWWNENGDGLCDAMATIYSTQDQGWILRSPNYYKYGTIEQFEQDLQKVKEATNV